MNEKLSVEEIKKGLSDFIVCLECEALECIRRGDTTREKLFKDKIEEVNKMIETIHLGGRTEDVMEKAINMVKEGEAYITKNKKQKMKSIIFLGCFIILIIYLYFFNK